MEKNKNDRQGAGGTPGGLIEFFAGVVLIVIGSYLFLSRVIVTTSFYWRIGRNEYNSFGFAMLPVLIGVGFLFFSRRSRIGWLLTLIGVALLIFVVLSNLTFYFEPTNLITTLAMLGMIAGGLGLVVRALQPHNMG